uniref:Uncharacterized protein n=1 Tax=Denticeps clupeoides TaxID=299321 RepID=A0AAY4F0Y9_9TELE
MHPPIILPDKSLPANLCTNGLIACHREVLACVFSHLDLGILCHSSLQTLSSSGWLDGKRWWTAIFRSLQNWV